MNAVIYHHYNKMIVILERTIDFREKLTHFCACFGFPNKINDTPTNGRQLIAFGSPGVANYLLLYDNRLLGGKMRPHHSRPRRKLSLAFIRSSKHKRRKVSPNMTTMCMAYERLSGWDSHTMEPEGCVTLSKLHKEDVPLSISAGDEKLFVTVVHLTE